MGRNKKKLHNARGTIGRDSSTETKENDHPDTSLNGDPLAQEGNAIQVQVLINGTDNPNGIKSRQVFVATICHTCKGGQATDITSDNAGVPKLFNCGNCRMIRYCSKDHQLGDWENHKQLCGLIRKVLKKEKKKHLYDGSSKCSLTDESKWLQIRHSYMTLFSEQLKRDLSPYEKEMLLFPQICFSCRENSSSEMIICEKCHMASFCPEHHSQDHDHCNELKLWVNLVRFENENSLIRPLFNPEATLNYTDTQKEFPSDIISFFKNFKFHNTELQNETNVWMAGVTDVATVPLSILWTLKTQTVSSRKIQKNLMVHLLGSEMDFEGSCAKKWETFLLHLLPEIKQLTVILIGPELPNFPCDADTCSTCKSKGRGIKIEQKSGYLYHEYVTEDDFVKPDIICAFNGGIYRKTGYNGEDTWGPTIPFLAQAKLVITTAYTEIESKHDCSRILTECPTLKSAASLKNPFRSLRPQRTLVNENKEPVMFKNQYINVFI